MSSDEPSDVAAADAVHTSGVSIGALIGGRFRLEALAGSGGMGAVYRAHDTTTGETVAVKLLHLHAYGEAARLAREAQALAELNHPNIVRYVAHASLDVGLPYLAMEWLEGEDLHARLDRGPMPIAEAVALAATVADALHAAHRRGLVHRDIKPSNILLHGSTPEAVKVLDFGIVRWQSRAITATGIAFGTPGYMAPEQCRGAGKADARADVFSLGCVLFEAITGMPVFTGENVMAVLAKLMLEDAPLLSELVPGAPPALEELLARMLAKDPDARPADAGAVAAELRALDLGAEPGSTAASKGRRAVTEGERRVVSVVLARRRGSAAAAAPQQPPSGALRAAVWPHGERLEILADGSIVVVPGRGGSAREHANEATRCALAMRRHLPGWSLSIGSGRVDASGGRSIGEAIDRASRVLGAAGTIHIDEATAALIDPRFEVSERGSFFVLVGEEAQVEHVRKVLGKPTPCVGRDGDLAALHGYLDDCIAQPRARPIVVTGAPGIGKSRLRAEFLRTVRARLPDVEIWRARADPVSAGSPFAMVAAAIRHAAGLEGAPPEVGRERLRAFVARHVADAERPRVTEFLGELVGASASSDASVQLRAARRDAALMGDQMTRALIDVFAAECAVHPLLLVLEDLHWGDLPSAKAIDAALRVLKDLPLMVLALARAEVHDLFPRLWNARGVIELPLSELGAKAAEELVRTVLGDAVSPAAARRLVERSAGNPFFLEELIRAAARGEAEASLPDTVLGVVEGRLEQLSPEARRSLRAASVFGLVFWGGAISALLGERRSAVESAPIRELIEHEVIHRRAESRFSEQTEYVFHHAVIRDAAYSMLTDGDKLAGHHLAGNWLEESGERDSAVLAQHFEAGGDHQRAVVHYERAAAHALEGNDFAAIHARVARGIACGATGQLLGQLRVLEARAKMWSGDNEGALRAAETALGDFSERTPAWYDASWVIATTSIALGHPERVEEVALLVGHDMPDAAASAWFSACSMIGINLLLCDRVLAATSLLECLCRVPASFLEDDPMARAQLASFQQIWMQHAGDLGARVALLRQAVEGFDLLGAVRPASLQRVNLAWAYVDLGAFAAAEELCVQIISTAEQNALVYVGHGARYCFGRALTRRGRWDEARAMLEQAATGFEAGNNRRLAGATRIALVDLCLAAGDVEGAAAEVEKAIVLVEQLAPFLALALATRAQVRLQQGGRAAEALADAQEAVAPLQLGQRAVEGEARVQLAYAEALRATGALELACAEILAAKSAVEARSAKITDTELRRSFLENVPENVRTMELSRAWLTPKV